MSENTSEIQVEEGVCNKTFCFRDEPEDLVDRRLKGTEYEAQYCTEHDPLNDPSLVDQWEPVNGITDFGDDDG